MQRKILKLLMFVSKTVYYLFILQLVGLQLLMANDTRGQSLQKIRISLEVEDASIKEVFNVIESKTDLGFVHDRVLDEIRTEFDLSYKDETLKRILEDISKDTGLSFYSEQSELGRWLRTKNIIEIVGDHLFLHAGLSRKVNELSLSVEQINALARPVLDLYHKA